ncbi:hypothetical protein [Aurantiacibacter arachoides]|uniref:hypothetical protein n=1 Tax=Aurantiacibacter arachoides TaxID=1850444 RepID=UPI00103CF762|nr:hypothetical protein [Aurantiacibacter arachoides]
MSRLAPTLALPLFMLAACDAVPAERALPVESADAGNPSDTTRPVAPPPVASATTDPADGVNDGVPDLIPAPLTPEAERTETGARNVLLAFARAIELREWDQAWTMMSEADRQHWDKAEFAALFADLHDITVAVPTGTMEGAAGSSFYTAPVTITGADPDGRPIAYTGEIVLRRVNDIDGASPEQLHWHFESTTLDWTH